MKKNITNNGFTLAELLITISLIGIIIVSMAIFFAKGFISIKKNNALIPAINMATQHIEKIRQMDYDTIKSNYYPDTLECDIKRNNIEYNVAITAEMLYSGDIVDLTIDIKWEDGGKESGKKNITMETYIYTNK